MDNWNPLPKATDYMSKMTAAEWHEAYHELMDERPTLELLDGVERKYCFSASTGYRNVQLELCHSGKNIMTLPWHQAVRLAEFILEHTKKEKPPVEKTIEDEVSEVMAKEISEGIDDADW